MDKIVCRLDSPLFHSFHSIVIPFICTSNYNPYFIHITGLDKHLTFSVYGILMKYLIALGEGLMNSDYIFELTFTDDSLCS